MSESSFRWISLTHFFVSCQDLWVFFPNKGLCLPSHIDCEMCRKWWVGINIIITHRHQLAAKRKDQKRTQCGCCCEKTCQWESDGWQIWMKKVMKEAQGTAAVPLLNECRGNTVNRPMLAKSHHPQLVSYCPQRWLVVLMVPLLWTGFHPADVLIKCFVFWIIHLRLPP